MAIKRNIKDITVKSTTKNIEEEKIINTSPIKKSNVSEKEDLKKKKRTLHLNLGETTSCEKEIENTTTDDSIQTSSIPHVVDTSVNQNSPFFYEPSVFEKFSINVTNIESDTEINKQISEAENTINTDLEDNIDTSETDTDFEDNADEKEIIELADTTKSENTVNDEEINETENVVSLEDNIYEEDIKETKHIISLKTNFNNEIYTENDSEDDDYTETNLESDTTLDIPVSAGTIDTKTDKKAVFKKFTFEDTPVTNSETDIKNSIKNLETPTVDIPVVNTINTVESNLNQNTKTEEPEVLAEPVATITAPDLVTEINTVNDSTDLGYDIDYSTIITTGASDDISFYDDIVDELINNVEFDDTEDSENTLDESNTLEIEDDVKIANNEEATIEEDIKTEDLLDIEEIIDIADADILDLEETPVINDIENTDVFDIGINKNQDSETNDENTFSLESYFNINTTEENTIENEELETEANEISETTTEVSEKNTNSESDMAELLKTFNQTLSTLADRIANLEAQKQEPTEKEETIIDEDINVDEFDLDTDLENELLSEILSDEETLSEKNIETTIENNVEEEISSDEITEEISLENLSEEILLEEISDEDIIEENIFEEEVLEETENNSSEKIENTLLEDVLLENIYEEDLKKITQEDIIETIDEATGTVTDSEPASDFFTIIDSLSKTISELENSPDIKNSNTSLEEHVEDNGKSINILINKDDIFSISILNETYDIVADFDGISVLSENIHISTPKNNFFVEIGDKYIEIHNKNDHFFVDTNFEDVEFTNAINNVSFSKKENNLELNIKEAFKLSSVNNKIELSMLNTSIADISKNQEPDKIDENSICDNRTLLISEETQKVYLPYTIEEVMNKLNSDNSYQTAKEVIEKEYTLPLSTFKSPIISRFREAYRFMRVKEKSSVYAAIDLALELMFNSNLNPAIIRAAKDLKELNIYLDCLYENEVEKFDCFKIVYKILPKIK